MSETKKKPTLRSAAWFGTQDKNGFMYRSWMKNQGIPDHEAGGFPVEFPVFSNGESNLRPTAMLTRSLASMDVEESIRGNPMDGVVLLVSERA